MFMMTLTAIIFSNFWNSAPKTAEIFHHEVTKDTKASEK